MTTEVQWTTSDPDVAEVAANGRVTTRNAGIVEIRATYQSVIGAAQLAVAAQPVPALYTLSGVVRDAATGAAMKGAQAEVIDGPSAGKTATADGTGRYVLTGLSTGAFRVYFRNAGYHTFPATVTLSGDQSLDVALRVSPPPPAPPSQCPVMTLTPARSNLTVGVAFAQALTVKGGTAPYGFVVDRSAGSTAGQLPDGTHLTADPGSQPPLPPGVFWGTPTAAAVGAYAFLIGVTDANGCYTAVPFAGTVSASPSSPAPPPPPQYRLGGTVRDGLDQQLMGRNLDVIISVADTGRRANVDDDGTYALFLPAGSYSVTASHEGYASRTHQITLTANSVLDFTLTPVPGSVRWGSLKDRNRYPMRVVCPGRVEIVDGPDAGRFTVVPVGANWEITNVRPGTLTLRASAHGYQTQERTLRWRAHGFNPLEFLMCSADGCSTAGPTTCP